MRAPDAGRVPSSSQRGFSLIELMTALVLGLLMVKSVITDGFANVDQAVKANVPGFVRLFRTRTVEAP